MTRKQRNLANLKTEKIGNEFYSRCTNSVSFKIHHYLFRKIPDPGIWKESVINRVVDGNRITIRNWIFTDLKGS